MHTSLLRARFHWGEFTGGGGGQLVESVTILLLGAFKMGSDGYIGSPFLFIGIPVPFVVE
jgi:hypothetical protein